MLPRVYFEMVWNREGQALNDKDVDFIVAFIMVWIERQLDEPSF